MCVVREKIFRIVEKDTDYYEWYDIVMLIFIWISIIPLTFKIQNKITYAITITTTIVFIIDYTLRWITSDFRLKEKRNYKLYKISNYTISNF